MKLRQFAETLTHHPILSLNDTASGRNGEVTLQQTPAYKKKLITTIIQDTGVKELYNTIMVQRAVQYTHGELAHLLNSASEGMLNNLKVDEERKDIYLNIVYEQTNIHKDILRSYYQTYQKVMTNGYLTYATIIDDALKQLEKLFEPTPISTSPSHPLI